MTDDMIAFARRIDAEHSAVATALQSALSHAISAGEMLIEAKREVKRNKGKWLPWLEAHLPTLPPRTASHYVRLAKRRADLCDEIGNVLPISVTDAMATLSHPIERGFPFSEWGDYTPCGHQWGRPAWGSFSSALQTVTSLADLKPPAPRHVVKAALAGKTSGLTAPVLRQAIALLTRYAEALEKADAACAQKKRAAFNASAEQIYAVGCDGGCPPGTE